MNTSTLVGIDLGKHAFHLHGQDASGRETFRKKLSRLQMMRFLISRLYRSGRSRMRQFRTYGSVRGRQVTAAPTATPCLASDGYRPAR